MEDFQWSDGSKFELASHLFVFNNYEGDDYCVESSPTRGHTLQDQECTYPQHFVCHITPGMSFISRFNKRLKLKVDDKALGNYQSAEIINASYCHF